MQLSLAIAFRSPHPSSHQQNMGSNVEAMIRHWCRYMCFRQQSRDIPVFGSARSATKMPDRSKEGLSRSSRMTRPSPVASQEEMTLRLLEKGRPEEYHLVPAIVRCLCRFQGIKLLSPLHIEKKVSRLKVFKTCDPGRGNDLHMGFQLSF